MITVRVAHPDDAEALAAAHIEGWRVGYRGLMPDEFLDAPEFAAQRLDRWRMWTWRDWAPGSELFVGVDNGRAVGFGHVGAARTQPQCDQASPSGTAFSTTTGEVYAFYVHPDAWGSGAAAAIMQRCRQFLQEHGFVDAVLWVLRDNPRARAFYEKTGWTGTGRSTDFAGPSTAAALPSPITEVEYRTIVH